jgi:PncC family amidohydrolase
MCDLDVARAAVALLKGRSVATAESCTAGRVAEVLAALPGAADFFKGGIVAYHEMTKRDILNVSAESVLSNTAAEEMALGALRLFDAQVAIATTGVAGTDPVEGNPPGTVYVATAVDERVVSRRYLFGGDPEHVCVRARRQALIDLRRALEFNPLRRASVPSPDAVHQV